MFKWLANLIVNSPVQGTCACGASHRAKLRQMQKEILAENGAEVPEDAVNDSHCCCGGGERSCHCGNGGGHCCNGGGDCSCQHGEGHKCSCQHKESAAATHSYNYDGMVFGSTSLSAHFDLQNRSSQSDDPTQNVFRKAQDENS